VGCVGVTGLLDDLKARRHQAGAGHRRRADADEVVGAHKGGAKLVTAAAAGRHHSSAPEKAPMP
jgi:hypothetical protein